MPTKVHNSQNYILLITSSNFPYGGASANLLRLFSIGLSKEGNSVSVLIQRGKQFGKQKQTTEKKNSIESIDYEYCGFVNRPNSIILKIVDNILGILIPLLVILKKKIKNSLNVIVVYNSNMSEKVLVLLLAKLLNVKIIDYVVEWYAKDYFITHWTRYFAWWNFLFSVRVLDNYFNGLIVTSTFLKKYFIERGMKEENILLLPNLVDLSTFSTDVAISVNSQSDVVIGYSGTPVRKDGIDDLLSAFKIVKNKKPNTILFIIGDVTGSASVIPALKKKAEEMSIGDSVEFSGLVDWNRVPALLHKCDILVLTRPSGKFAEAGFPTKLGEYMACKKPVVVTKVGDLPLYLENRKSAMIAEPDNPQSIADKIIELIDNPVLAKTIAENGYIWSNEKLNYLKAIKKVSIYFDKFSKM